MMRTPEYFQTQAGRHDRWLISYVDIVTILLILFVAATAHGLHRAEAKSLPVPLRAPVPRAEPASKLLIAKEKFERLGVDVEVRQRSLIVSLRQAVLFASGDDQIGDDALPVIAAIAHVLLEIPGNKVTLIGHADASPIHGGRFHSNWELSAARSLRLLELLTNRYSLPEDRLSISSQGSLNPKSPNETPDGRAANRRVEIVVQGDE